MSSLNWYPENVNCICTNKGYKSIWIEDKERNLYYCACCGVIIKKPNKSCATCMHAGHGSKQHDSHCNYCNKNLSEWKEVKK